MPGHFSDASGTPSPSRLATSSSAACPSRSPSQSGSTYETVYGPTLLAVTSRCAGSLRIVESSIDPRKSPGEPATGRRVTFLPGSAEVAASAARDGSAAEQTPPVPQAALVVQAPPSVVKAPAPTTRHFASK